MCSDTAMRAALPVVFVQCMLLASTARATEPAAAPVSAAAPADVAAIVSHPTPTPSAVSAVAPPPGTLAPELVPDPADLLFASPTRVDRIGRIVASVMVNGRGPYRFIIDTGANYSTVSPQLAAGLGLEPAADATVLVNGVTGSAQVPSVQVAKLQAGDLIVENSQMPVVWAPVMGGADGILGMAGLTNEQLLVDFHRNRVEISRSRGVPRHFVRVPATRVNGGLVSIDAHVGNVRVEAIIDTGSERTMGNLALQQALYAGRRYRKSPTVTDVYGATTHVASGQLEMAPTIDLGAVQIGSTTLVFGDFHIFKIWGLTQRPALIVGMDVLGSVAALGIDFRHAEVYLDAAYHDGPATGALAPCHLSSSSVTNRCSG